MPIPTFPSTGKPKPSTPNCGRSAWADHDFLVATNVLESRVSHSLALFANEWDIMIREMVWVVCGIIESSHPTKGRLGGAPGWMSENYLSLQQREKCFLLTSPFIEPGKVTLTAQSESMLQLH